MEQVIFRILDLRAEMSSSIHRSQIKLVPLREAYRKATRLSQSISDALTYLANTRFKYADNFPIPDVSKRYSPALTDGDTEIDAYIAGLAQYSPEKTYLLDALEGERGAPTLYPDILDHAKESVPIYDAFQWLLDNYPDISTAYILHKGGRQKQFAILVRSRGDCVWRRLDSDISVSVSGICDKTGVAAIAIKPDDDWYSNEPIAFVENDFCLWNCERFPLPEEVTSVIAYHGMADSRLIDWLGFRKRAPNVFWCPDYDYVGLNNYLRASAKADVQLWIPPTFDLILKSTAVNPERLRRQKHLVENLRQSNDPDVQKVLSSLMVAGGGTDHEAFIE